MVFIDLNGGTDDVQYVLYDNGAGGVGLIDFGVTLNLSLTNGDDFLLT